MKDIRDATLDAIVKDGKVRGFEVNGFDNGRMDGYGYHLAVGKISILPTPPREDAPVFWVEEHRYFENHRNANEYRKSCIVLGEQEAIQKAYQIALEYAIEGVKGRNEWIKCTENWSGVETIRGEAILIDRAKDKIPR